MELKQLESICGAKGVVSDAEGLKAFAVDGITPQIVAQPETLKQAAAVIKLAGETKTPLAILGGGSLAGLGGRIKAAGVVLSTRRLDKIIDMDTENLTVTAQAGVRIGDLQDLLGGLENRCFFPIDSSLKNTADYMCSSREYKGAYVPLDPPQAQRATMGGIVASGVTGPMRLRHGLPRDLVLGVRFVSAQGELIGMGGKVVKNVSGYDVSKLMVGSLGSLGLIGEMTVRLLPLPEVSGAVVMGFKDLASATAMAAEVVDGKLLPTALEVVNAKAMQMALKDAPAGSWFVAAGQAGFSEDVAREKTDLAALAARHGGQVADMDADAAKAFWAALADRPLMDCALRLKASYPIGGAGAFLAAAAGLGDGAAVSVSAGLGAGLVHLLPAAAAELAKAAAGLRAKAVELGGALVVQAGAPELKDAVGAWGPARPDWGLMMHLKRQLDPDLLLNRGRFLGGL
ncbi:MAG: FAD-binding oxidoreductase [Thermodesulfobacteriota bacterium]